MIIPLKNIPSVDLFLRILAFRGLAVKDWCEIL